MVRTVMKMKLLETCDEAEVKDVNEPLNDFGLKDGRGKEVDNRPYRNVGNIDNRKQWFNEGDFEEYFIDDIVDPELFPEPEHEVQDVAEDRYKEGLEFQEKEAFQKNLRKYCVSTRTVCRMTKSDNIRIKAVCKGFGEPILCPWYISARRIPGEPTWSIRDFHLHHTCIRDPYGRNSCANPAFVAQHVIDKLRESPGHTVPKPSEIAAEFWTSHNILIPYHVALKAINNVLERINGSFDDSFRLIPSLCEMIKRTNLGSVATFTYGRYCAGYYSVNNYQTTYAP
ncbi:hypothetical protein MKX01_014134, partial [Papaver californicum]